MASGIHLVHVIPSLGYGGAELFLGKLISRLSHGFRSSVLVLSDGGPLVKSLESQGVTVEALGLQSLLNPQSLRHLSHRLSAHSPDVLHTWLARANVAGGLANRWGPRAPLLWSAFQFNFEWGVNSPGSLALAKAAAWLSRFLPDRVLFDSQAGAQAHERLGYKPATIQIIPNGYDLSVFKPDPVARAAVRRELGLGEMDFLVGLVARFNAHKDHETFVSAAGILAETEANAHFLLCGEGIDERNTTLLQWIEATRRRNRFHLLGQRTDIPRLTAALDVAALSSRGESFPNVVGEAMAAGIPCAVTNVGDTAILVGDTGRVVPPRKPAALAAAFQELAILGPDGRRRLGEAARQRIQNLYSLDRVVTQYEALYRQLHRLGRQTP